MIQNLLNTSPAILFALFGHFGHIANANPPGVSGPGFGKGPVYLGPQKILQSGRPTPPFQVKTIGVYVVQTADDDGSNRATIEANVIRIGGTNAEFQPDKSTVLPEGPWQDQSFGYSL